MKRKKGFLFLTLVAILGFVGFSVAATIQGIDKLCAYDNSAKNAHDYEDIYTEDEINAGICQTNPKLYMVDDDANMLPRDCYTIKKSEVCLAEGRNLIVRAYEYYTFTIYIEDYKELKNATPSENTGFTLSYHFVTSDGDSSTKTTTTFDGDPNTAAGFVGYHPDDMISIETLSEGGVMDRYMVCFFIPPYDGITNPGIACITDFYFTIDGNREYGNIQKLQMTRIGSSSDYPGDSDYAHASCGLEGYDMGPYKDGEGIIRLNVKYGDQNITPDVLKSSLKAYDVGDGKIEEVTLLDDQYTPNKTKLDQDLPMTFQAKDSSNNKSVFKYLIRVYDKACPIITPLNLDIRYSYKKKLTPLEVLSNYSITDNYVIQATTVIEGIDFDTPRTTIGVANIRIVATDASGNVMKKSSRITFYDDIPPVISGNDEMNMIAGETPSESEILSQYTSTDEIDGDCSISIINNTLKGNEHKPGIYSMDLNTKDKAGNEATKTVTIKLQDTTGPVFYVSKTYLEAKFGTGVISPDQAVASLVRNGVLSKKNYTYSEYMGGDYGENENPEVGEYHTTLAAYADDGSIEYVDLTIGVVGNEQGEEVQYSFWDRICMLFASIWNFLAKLFSLAL